MKKKLVFLAFCIGVNAAQAQSWSPIKELEPIYWSSDNVEYADNTYRALRDVKGGKAWEPQDRDYYFALRMYSNVEQKKLEQCINTQEGGSFWDDAWTYISGRVVPETSTLIIINSTFKLRNDVDDEAVISSAPLVVAGYGINATTKTPGNGCFIDGYRGTTTSKFIRYRGQRSEEKDTYSVRLVPVVSINQNSEMIRAATRAATSIFGVFSLNPLGSDAKTLIAELNKYEEEFNRFKTGSAQGKVVSFTITPFGRPDGSGRVVRVFGANVGGEIKFFIFKRASHILASVREGDLTTTKILDVEIPFAGSMQAVRTALEQGWVHIKTRPVFSNKPADAVKLYEQCDQLRNFVTTTHKFSTMDALLIRLAVAYEYNLPAIFTELYLVEADKILKQANPGWSREELVKLCLAPQDQKLAADVAFKAGKPLKLAK